VGWLFRFADPVPVERQQDLTKKGKGKITITIERSHSHSHPPNDDDDDNNKNPYLLVRGSPATRFMEEMPRVDKGKYQLRLALKEQKKPVMLTVKKVLSNHELLLETTSTLGGFTQSPADVMIKGVDYKIVPPVSHDEMFNAVYDHLGQVSDGPLSIEREKRRDHVMTSQ
jgi:hypothetical protein